MVPSPGDPEIPERTERLVVTVGQVWREERVSCPHRDLLRQYLDGGMDEGAAGYVRFHLEEAACPYCQAQIEDMRRIDAEATKEQLVSVRDRLLESTRLGLEKARRSS